MKKILLSAGVVICALSADAQKRIPLFEVFTSSTCGPCKAGNEVYETVIKNKPATDFVSVKFQQDFPGTGDPYSTAETISRRNFYAINSIPRMEIDGGWDQNAQSFTDALYTAETQVPAKYNLSGTFDVTNKVVTANLKWAPLTTITVSHKLYVAVIEKHTQKNIKSNGETKFYNVVKKMLPFPSGTTLGTFNVGDQDSISLSFQFEGDYRLPADGQPANHINNYLENSVEYFENLRVVAWVQASDKEVYNAANLIDLAPKGDPTGVSHFAASFSTSTVFPNPATNVLNINLNMSKSDEITASLADMKGAIVATQTSSFNPGQHQMTIDTHSLAAGNYTLILMDSKSNAAGREITIVR